MANRLSLDVDDELEPEVAKFLQDMRVFISGWYGDRCSTRQPGCKCCQVWSLYDAFEMSFDPR